LSQVTPNQYVHTSTTASSLSQESLYVQNPAEPEWYYNENMDEYLCYNGKLYVHDGVNDEWKDLEQACEMTYADSYWDDTWEDQTPLVNWKEYVPPELFYLLYGYYYHPWDAADYYDIVEEEYVEPYEYIEPEIYTVPEYDDYYLPEDYYYEEE
jgi:hypothetical protein